MELAQKALAMDDSMPCPRLIGYLYAYKGSMKRRLLKGNGLWPLNRTGRVNAIYANILLGAGQLKEAIPIFQKAIRLAPIGVPIDFNLLGFDLSADGQFNEAVSTSQTGSRGES